MFIDPGSESTTALQRSAMCSSDESGRQYVSLLWSEENLLGAGAFYKHFGPTGRGNCLRSLEKKRLDGWTTEA